MEVKSTILSFHSRVWQCRIWHCVKCAKTVCVTNTEKKVMINPTPNENGKNEFPKEIMFPSFSKISLN